MNRQLLHGIELPKRIPEKDMPDLLRGVRERDPEAINIMILGHIRLAISIVSHFLCRCGLSQYAAELDGVAMEAVVVAVNRIADGKMKNHDNATGFITLHVRYHIEKAAHNYPPVHVPRGKELPRTQSLSDLALGKGELIYEIEILDMIESIVTNDTERRILELRRIGHTDAEIGEILEFPRLKVHRIRHKLLDRYSRKERTNV